MVSEGCWVYNITHHKIRKQVVRSIGAHHFGVTWHSMVFGGGMTA